MSLRVASVLPLLLLLSACNFSAPPPSPPAAAAPPVSTPDCLANLPGTALDAPLAQVYTQDFSAPALDEAAQRCIGALLGEQDFASPQQHDPAYATLQQAQGEDARTSWNRTPKKRVQWLRIAQSAAASTWLLRIDTGLPPPGARYDLLLTSDAQGHLRDQMLVGTSDSRFRRTMDLRSSNQFSLTEQSTREDQPGLNYRAAFRIDDSGRIALDSSAAAGMPPDPPGATATDSSGSTADEGDSGTSLEQVDGPAGDAEAIRRLLFSDSGVIEELVQRESFADGGLAMLAVGRIDAAGLIVYVFRPLSGAAAGKVQYQVASYVLPEPAQALGGELGKVSWQADKGGVSIVLPMRYEFLRDGGDADSSEPETQGRDASLRLRYDSAEGELKRQK